MFRRFWLLLAMVAFWALQGCGSGSGANGGGFESDDPGRVGAGPGVTVGSATSTTGGSVTGTGTGGTGGSTGGGLPPGGDAARAIIEADIIQVQDNTLYALSEYGGLSVIDIANPDDLRMVGRYAMRGRPFEMYVRSGVAYAMYSSFPRYEPYSELGYYRSIVSSRIVALDVTNPAAMKEVGVFDMPGEISDSRQVGDIMYVVSYENGDCWGCTQSQPRTTVMSIAIGDPAHIRKVDQLAFNDQKNTFSWYRRSIHVTTDRLYVSGMVYDNFWGQDTGHSTIQVVDISDPGGKLVPGAQVSVNGQIESRWQMDEFEGVLRVVSQSGSTWSNGPPPVVETFRVESAQSLVPLGKLTLQLPKRENLKSARFDGPRGYAVTFEQKDPLFTIDLSNPALPKQAGEVEMPGYLFHMEPRGARLVALGIDNTNTSGGLTVSIFDVADLGKPTLLSRANFGTQWGQLPEDQDRIHKAFRIFDQENLVVMPFAGWSYSLNTGPYACGSYMSGVQLLDLKDDKVTARGVVPLRGQARRAFLHGGNLFAVSDDQVASYAIANRDVPTHRDTLALANVADKTVRVGEYLVELGSDWWTSEPQITVVPLKSGAQGIPVATIDLAKTINTTNDPCYRNYWGAFAGSSQLFVNGSSIYVAYDAGFTGQSGKGRVGFAVIDMSDPAHPALRGSALLEIGRPSSPEYPYGYDGFGVGYYYSPTGIFPSGERIVQAGSTLILQELVHIGPSDSGWQARAIMHAVDLSDPAKIRLASSVPILEGASATGLVVDGSNVFTSHRENVPERPGRTRFFVDRIDYSNPSAPTRVSVNVPGSLLAVDRGGSRVVTVDYTRTVTQETSWEACQPKGGFSTTWLDYDPMTGMSRGCVWVRGTLRLVDLTAIGASIVHSFDPTGGVVTGVHVGDDRIWLARGRFVTVTGPDGREIGGRNETEIETLTGIRSGALVSRSTTAIAGSTVVAERAGTRLAVASLWETPSVITVVDTADASNPRRVVERIVSRDNYYWGGQDLTLDPNYVIWSMGKYGAETIPLP